MLLCAIFCEVLVIFIEFGQSGLNGVVMHYILVLVYCLDITHGLLIP